MMLQKYSPKRSLPSVFDNVGFDSMFSTLLDQFLSVPELTEESIYSKPAIYSHVHDNEYIVSADLPGYGKEDIKVEVTDDSVKIQGELKEDNSRRAAFRREFTIPVDVDREKIRAALEKGVLEVVLPRKQKEVRTIEIV